MRLTKRCWQQQRHKEQIRFYLRLPQTKVAAKMLSDIQLTWRPLAMVLSWAATKPSTVQWRRRFGVTWFRKEVRLRCGKVKGRACKKMWSVKSNRTNMNGDTEMRQTIKTSSFKKFMLHHDKSDMGRVETVVKAYQIGGCHNPETHTLRLLQTHSIH